MTKDYLITENDLRKRTIVITMLTISCVILVLIQTNYKIFNVTLFGVIFMLILIGIIVSLNFICTYKVIGKFSISLTKLKIEINNNVDIIEIGTDKYEYIKFVYKAFEGEAPLSTMIGKGAAVSASGTGNTFEIATKEKKINFEIKIETIQDYDILNRLLKQINEIGHNVFISENLF